MNLLPVSIHHVQPNGAPDPIGCDAAAAKFIPTIRQVVNEEPTFFSRGGSEKVGSERAQREQERRDMERELYRELARYYPQPDGAWKYPELLSKGKQGLIRCTGNILVTHLPISSGGFRS